MMRVAQFLLVPSAALCLASCASLGGNVKSDFQCKAPGGICSPTSSIDDQALAVIGEPNRRSVAFAVPPAGPKPGGLRVVLPARVDRFGHWREETVVYVDRGSVDAPLAVGSGAGGRVSRDRLSLAELASGAPELGSLDGAGSRVASTSSDRLPVDPLASIRAEVEAELDQAPRFISRPVIQGQTSHTPEEMGSGPQTQSDFAPGDEVGSPSSSDPSGTAVAPPFPASDLEGG